MNDPEVITADWLGKAGIVWGILTFGGFFLFAIYEVFIKLPYNLLYCFFAHTLCENNIVFENGFGTALVILIIGIFSGKALIGLIPDIDKKFILSPSSLKIHSFLEEKEITINEVISAEMYRGYKRGWYLRLHLVSGKYLDIDNGLYKEQLLQISHHLGY